MKKLNIRTFLSFKNIIVVIVLATLAFEGVSMSLFTNTEEEVVLFSEMKGHITLNGNIVSGAVVERWIKWKDQDGDKELFTTDDRGAFYLPAIKVNTKLPKLSQLVITQEINVLYENINYKIWALSKMNKNEFGELDGKPINFRCELSSDEKALRFENAYLLTNCEWDEIIKID